MKGETKMASFEEKILEVLSSLNDDDDFLDAVKENIQIDSFVKDAIDQNEKVKKNLMDLLISYIKDIDLSDYEIDDQITEAINIKDFVESDEKIAEAVKEKARQLTKEEIEIWESDSGVADTIKDELVVKIKTVNEIIKEDDIQKKLREKIKELITNEINLWGSNDQDDDDFDTLMEPIRESLTISDSLAQEIVQDPETQRIFEEKIKQLTADTIENLAEEKETSIKEMISEDRVLNGIISNAIDEAIKSRDTEQIIKDAVLKVVKNNLNLDSILSQGISNVISERLAEGILKISFGDRR